MSFQPGNPSKLRHGHAKRGAQSGEHRCWQAMKRRCLDPNHKKYKFYGGNGVEVCNRWANSFENFLEDVGLKPTPQHTLDRYPNPAGNYEPGNVRWATKREQSDNRVAPRLILIDEQEIVLSAYCAAKGLDLDVIRNRLDLGWPVARALSQPILRRNTGPRS